MVFVALVAPHAREEAAGGGRWQFRWCRSGPLLVWKRGQQQQLCTRTHIDKLLELDVSVDVLVELPEGVEQRLRLAVVVEGIGAGQVADALVQLEWIGERRVVRDVDRCGPRE